jgi:hypothetical protein
MAALRAVEERDGKGNVIRVNPTIVFKQDQQIRKVRGRHDWDLLDNPHYHPPISAQVQNGKIVFFSGTPESVQSRTFAKEISQAKVQEIAPYIIENLKRNPVRVREARPMVYEVRVANLDGQEVPVAEEVDTGGAAAITVSPVAPERWQGERGGSAVQLAE